MLQFVLTFILFENTSNIGQFFLCINYHHLTSILLCVQKSVYIPIIKNKLKYLFNIHPQTTAVPRAGWVPKIDVIFS